MGEFAIQSQLTPKLVDALYIEAMVLADEARSYFDTLGRDD
jgi:regulator of CtrA degradation